LIHRIDIVGSASVVKGLSTYLDSLCGYAMRDFLAEHLPINVHGLSAYPDLFAFIVTILFSWAIASGAKESTRVNNVFTMLNLGVVLFVIIAGLLKVSPRMLIYISISLNKIQHKICSILQLQF